MNIPLLLDMVASGQPDRVAFGPRHDATSYSTLDGQVRRCAWVIAERSPGHLFFVGRNGPAYVRTLFAAARAGVPFVPLNYRLAPEQLAALIGELERPLIVADDDYLDLMPAHAEVLPTERLNADAAAAVPFDGPPPDADDIAVMLFTSGTTAKPKAVVLRHAHLASYVFATVEFGAADQDEAALVTVPPYHVAAIGSALSNIYAGRRIVHLPDFEPAAWLRLVREEGITSAMVVPTMLARVLDVLDGSTAEAPHLRQIAYGGARMPRPVLETALRAFPSSGFCNAYGLTETSSTVALLTPEDHRVALTDPDPAVRARLGGVGRAVPGVQIQIRDHHGRPAGPGEVGSLWVRGAQVSGEYREQGRTLDPDGWFPTGDMASQDHGGYLFIVGRADDTIIRGGENIAPAEVEDVLLRHPDVADVAVVGAPDDRWGEALCAVVVAAPHSSATADDLRDFVRLRLRGSRTPDHVVWRDELPRTPTGKVLRRELVADIAQRPLGPVSGPANRI